MEKVHYYVLKGDIMINEGINDQNDDNNVDEDHVNEVDSALIIIWSR